MAITGSDRVTCFIRKTAAGSLLFPVLFLAGCGLTQTISDGTVEMTKSVFYKQVKVLHLDFTARNALNTDDEGASLSAIIRVYQLKTEDAFASADYPSLFATDSEVLTESRLAQKDVRIRPGESISLDMPMEKDAQFVAVAVMFHAPDQIENSWRVVIARDELEPDSPRKLELSENTLSLIPLKR